MTTTTYTAEEVLALIGEDEYVMPRSEYYPNERNTKVKSLGYINTYREAMVRNAYRAELRAKVQGA